jgi:hypothetical protein
MRSRSHGPHHASVVQACTRVQNWDHRRHRSGAGCPAAGLNGCVHSCSGGHGHDQGCVHLQWKGTVNIGLELRTGPRASRLWLGNQPKHKPQQTCCRTTEAGHAAVAVTTMGSVIDDPLRHEQLVFIEVYWAQGALPVPSGGAPLPSKDSGHQPALLCGVGAAASPARSPAASSQQPDLFHTCVL